MKSRHGTVLANNSFSFAFNLATADGDDDIIRGLHSYDSLYALLFQSRICTAHSIRCTHLRRVFYCAQYGDTSQAQFARDNSTLYV